jgi:hypothetical protein
MGYEIAVIEVSELHTSPLIVLSKVAVVTPVFTATLFNA